MTDEFDIHKKWEDATTCADKAEIVAEATKQAMLANKDDSYFSFLTLFIAIHNDYVEKNEPNSEHKIGFTNRPKDQNNSGSDVNRSDTKPITLKRSLKWFCGVVGSTIVVVTTTDGWKYILKMLFPTEPTE